MPSHNCQHTRGDCVNLIHGWIACAFACIQSLVIDLIDLIEVVAAVIQTRDRPRLCRLNQFLDPFLAIAHQDIVCILASLWQGDLPTGILTDPARQFFGCDLAGPVSICADDHALGSADLVLCLPHITEFVVILRIDLAINKLERSAVRYRHGTCESTFNERQGIHLAFADNHILICFDVVDVPQRGGCAVAREPLAARPPHLLCVFRALVDIRNDNHIDFSFCRTDVLSRGHKPC